MSRVDNKNHPELQEGEVFYCNTYDRASFERIVFTTKRMGEVAYSEGGRRITPVPGGSSPFPVFVQQSELDECNFNKNHPELRDGEVFLSNCTDNDMVGWKTKRSGNVSYDTSGKRIVDSSDLHPVFVKQSELDEAGVTLDD